MLPSHAGETYLHIDPLPTMQHLQDSPLSSQLTSSVHVHTSPRLRLHDRLPRLIQKRLFLPPLLIPHMAQARSLLGHLPPLRQLQGQVLVRLGRLDRHRARHVQELGQDLRLLSELHRDRRHALRGRGCRRGRHRRGRRVGGGRRRGGHGCDGRCGGWRRGSRGGLREEDGERGWPGVVGAARHGHGDGWVVVFESGEVLPPEMPWGPFIQSVSCPMDHGYGGPKRQARVLRSTRTAENIPRPSVSAIDLDGEVEMYSLNVWW